MAHASKPAIPRLLALKSLALLLMAGMAHAQTCLSAPDLDATIRKSLESTAEHYFEMSAQGDIAGLRQNSIPMVASNFAGVETAIKENQPNFSGAHAVVHPPFFLNADGSGTLAHAEFLCGVFGPSGQTSQSAVFNFYNLPPAKYAVAILDVSGGKKPLMLTLVLQQIGSDWKLAGYYARATQVAGHDSHWFETRARDFKAKGQLHNAWLYYREAIALSSPVDFMSTLASDKLYDEAHAVQPSDLPVDGSTYELAAAGKAYRLTDVFPLAVGDDLDLVVRYSSPDISNTSKAFQENMALIKAIVAKLPELRDAFAGMVARAVDPSGSDYGTMLPMKEIK